MIQEKFRFFLSGIITATAIWMFVVNLNSALIENFPELNPYIIAIILLFIAWGINK